MDTDSALKQVVGNCMGTILAFGDADLNILRRGRNE
jgi:hypothetical protein